ncbi:MAG: hypothetical protein JW957_07630 [Candidatus Omnitrophica bacterium]|nr:hypothetical protein [Candidatus Omnitrophota bacterium]
MIMWKRKAYRIVMGSIFPAAYLITGRPHASLMIASFFLALLLSLEYERRRNPKVWDYILGKAGGFFKRKPGMLTGDTYFIIAVFLLLFFPESISIAALFFLVFGDAGSGLIGTRFGRTQILPGKTLEGFAGGFLFNLAVALILFPILVAPFFVLLAGVLTASVVEILPLKIDDNLTVGISSAAVMLLLSF